MLSHQRFAVKITHAFCAHCDPSPPCVGSMVFTMHNPYAQAGEKQGEKRNSTHDDGGNIQKNARKKAPSAASLVP